jgi:hypothetical protein
MTPMGAAKILEEGFHYRALSGHIIETRSTASTRVDKP